MNWQENTTASGTTVLETVDRVKSILSGVATDSNKRWTATNQHEYRQLRDKLISDRILSPKVPHFVRSCREFQEFWSYIKQYSTYQERREHIREAFDPLLTHLESTTSGPADQEISGHLTWQKALERKKTDPDGAITAARTLLESTCKHILDEVNAEYDAGADLPKLYRLAAEQLKLSPSQHTEPIFKQILGGCTAVVEGIGAVRNKLSDAHGVGKNAPRASTRHAELVVSLAGAAAIFLFQTWEERSKVTSSRTPALGEFVS
jgi:hypothetical protein